MLDDIRNSRSQRASVSYISHVYVSSIKTLIDIDPSVAPLIDP